ncbi:MAG: DUF1697 domain-containing protein [Burkholderiales bacterium]
MARYVAFLRGVSPMNAKMADLKRCFELAGFSEVCTLLSSGNVAFSTRASSLAALKRRAEQNMQSELGRRFISFVRTADHLQELVASDPCAEIGLPLGAKRVVTFLRGTAELNVALPIGRAGATILKSTATEVFSAYAPSTDGPALMNLLERTFGADITTRTLDTVRKCACA